ncbi:17073_t:CDS:1, partial [Funneliformis geosporum]
SPPKSGDRLLDFRRFIARGDEEEESEMEVSEIKEEEETEMIVDQVSQLYSFKSSQKSFILVEIIIHKTYCQFFQYL